MGVIRHGLSVPLPHPPSARSLPLQVLIGICRFITLYLLAFYVIFECVLNVFAEVTQFADRGFYDAWWNSTTWDQVTPPCPKYKVDESSRGNGINQFIYFYYDMSTILPYQHSVYQKPTPHLLHSFYRVACMNSSWPVCFIDYEDISSSCRSSPPPQAFFFGFWCSDTVVDVSVTLDLYGEDKVFQGKTVIGTRHVLDWYFHGTEFIEFIVFDVLREGIFGYVLTWRGGLGQFNWGRWAF